MSDHDRYYAAQTMASSGELDESGFTLFRYHYIDHLSQQPWTTNAEVAAGLRWHAITEDTGGEAMQYWTRLTKKLSRGSPAPLLPEVMDNFLQGRYCAEKIDPDAKCMSVPSLVSEADGDIEDQSLCHSPLEPDTFDGQECANDTTLDLQQYVATLQSLPKGPERDAQFRCARNVFAESGQSLYHFHAAVILTTAGESWSEAPLHDLIRSSWDKMPQIDRDMWKDGTTRMHAAFNLRNPNGMCHFVCDRKSARSYKYRQCAQEALARVGVILGRDALQTHEAISGKTQKAEDNPLPTTQGQVSQEAGENPSSTPVLEYLCSGEVDETEPESLIQKLLSGIGKLQADGCLPLLRLRSAGMRINYDAKATDVTSVARRLRAATHRSLTVKRATRDSVNIRSHFEWVLQPLVCYNANSFQRTPLEGIASSFAAKAKLAMHYRSSIEWLKKPLKAPRPITEGKSDEVIRLVMDKVRKRVRDKEPQHPLLKTPQEALLNKTSYSGMQDATLIAKMEKWGLADNENGFARHIRDCFEWKGLASDEYEDMIEQKLYAFNRATRDLLFKEVKRSRLT
ncbi:hypothetical protein KC316_g15611 [Hortaea werneckii]|nr:hypothetical protein KC324_g13937 [Hortaea werneckii]KAI7539970.1 hypothetical protein KC316_g15611 [Hortaea werneckii]